MTVKGLDKLRTKIERGRKQIERGSKRGIKRDAARTVHTAKSNIVEQDAVASTELFRSFAVIERTHPNDVTGVRIENTAAHAGLVEYGTGQKGRYASPFNKKFDSPSMSLRLVANLEKWYIEKPSLYVENPTAAAWGTARIISGNTEKRSGTSAQPFFKPAWEANQKRFVWSVEHAVERAF